MDKLFCLLSFALYLFAPNQYSFLYCALLLGVISANAVYLFRKDFKIEILGFNTIFSLSIILVTYIYPLFIYQVLPTFSLFSFAYNEDVITKASAMVNLAYAMYVCGYMNILQIDIKNNLVNERKIFHFPKLIPVQRLSLLTKIAIFLFLLIIAAGGLKMFQSAYSGDELVHTSGIFGPIWVFFHPFCIILLIVNLHYDRKITYIILSLMMLILMAVGTRTLPLCVMLLMVYALCLKKDLSIKQIVIIGVIAFVSFSIVGRLRSGNADLSGISSSEVGLWTYFVDFIVCTRNQYVIFDHVQNQGTTCGVSSLGYILAVIPYAQSVFCRLFGVESSDIRSETLTTKWEDIDNGLGLGTHIVGDVYLAFGLIGVILLFYFLGYIVAKSRRYMFLGNRSGTIIYLVLLSSAMFMCRGSFFYSLKNIVWSLIMISFFSDAVKRKSV